MTKQELINELQDEQFIIGESLESLFNPDYSEVVDHTVVITDPSVLLSIFPDEQVAEFESVDDVTDAFLDVLDITNSKPEDYGLEIIETEESFA